MAATCLTEGRRSSHANRIQEMLDAGEAAQPHLRSNDCTEARMGI